MNDPSATIPAVQMILSWTLLGVLLAWMLFFAFLAFRPREVEKREAADLPTPSGAFPAIVSRTSFLRPAVAVDSSLGNAPATMSEQPGDVGAAPVA